MIEKELLIISNNVLSNTKNNGKTILSYIQDVNTGFIHQLYFSSEEPEIESINYFRISDQDIITGKFNREKRGGKKPVFITDKKLNKENKKIPRNSYTRIAREFLWYHSWKSKQLEEWLNQVNPKVVFFVAGDSGFAYSICEYIVDRYHARLVVYVTDDYVLPRKNEDFISILRRNYIKRKMEKCVQRADVFFTISEQMQMQYKLLFGVDGSDNTKSREESRTNSNIYREPLLWQGRRFISYRGGYR